MPRTHERLPHLAGSALVLGMLLGCAGQPAPEAAAPAVTADLSEDLAALDPVVEALPGRPAIKGFSWRREQRFRCGDKSFALQIYRNDAFARALGLSETQSAPAAEFALVPGGWFVQGSSNSEQELALQSIQDWLRSLPGVSEYDRATVLFQAKSQFGAEKPARVIHVAPYLIARTETTREVWRELARAVEGINPEPRSAVSVSDQCAVDNVSWCEISAWCQANRVRLPSETEWEFACRAGTHGRFNFGDESLTDAYMWHSHNSENSANEVARKQPNAFGLFDMHGNTAEFCQDVYAFTYPDRPVLRVMRGGSMFDRAEFCRSAARAGGNESRRFVFLGFRAACNVTLEQ